MRTLCKTHAPPQLQGMEYPSPDPETLPWEGGRQLRAVQEDHIFVV